MRSLCNYCNEREGVYVVTQNGNLCCENHRNKCPAIREKNRLGNLGKPRSEEVRKRMRKPKTKTHASSRLDFPLPFGPTIALKPGSKRMSVLCRNDLKPSRLIFFMYE